MAKDIKNIAKFSEDALDMAFKEMSPESRDSFQKGLDYFNSKLGTKEKKTTETRSKKKLSDEEIFTHEILPQIVQKIKALETKELTPGGLQIGIDFSGIATSFEDMKIEQFAEEHTKIVQLETSLKTAALIIQFIRGKCYLFAKDALLTTGSNLEAAVNKTFGVSYRTFLRYATLANMLIAFPRLIMCELSFTQILLHQKRLLKYLNSESGQELRHHLSFPVIVHTKDKTITIERCDIDVMMAKFSTNPDWEIHDKHDKKGLPNDGTVQKFFDCAVEAYREANEETDLLAGIQTVHM